VNKANTIVPPITIPPIPASRTMDTLADRLRKQLPETPPVSPPTGFQGQNGFSTPLFPSKPNILYIMADQLVGSV
jgi:hypothetical protein